MRTSRLAVLAAALILPASGGAAMAADSDPVFQVDFSNPSLSPSHWTLTLHPDGSGHFQSERGKVPMNGIEPPDVDREIRLSPTFAGNVFHVTRDHKLFQMDCEIHWKGVF